MFALRLEQLASRAYPGMNMRTHDNLRRAFLYNMPRDVEQRMRDYILNHEGRTGQRLGFDQIVRLANEHYNELGIEQGKDEVESEVITISHVTPKDSAPRKNIWNEIVNRYAPRQTSSPKAQKTKHQENDNFPRSQQKNSGNAGRAQGSTQNARKAQAGQQNTRRSAKLCHHCGKTNHTIDDCFLYQNICSFCRTKGHQREECRKLQQRKENNQSPSRAETPVCPYCSGDHFGINCQRQEDSARTSQRPSPKPQRPNQGARPKANRCTTCDEVHEPGACSGAPLNSTAP